MGNNNLFDFDAFFSHCFVPCYTRLPFARSVADSFSWKIYSVQPDTEAKVQLLRRWQSNADLDFFAAVHLNKSVSIMVTEATIGRFEQQLGANELKYHIVVDDVEDTMQTDRDESPKMKRSVLTTTSEFTFDHYWTYEEIYLYLNMLSTTFSNMTTLTTVGYSAEDREIMALEISFSDKANKSVVYLDSGMVAR
jgi:Carboxypeptidase activation peptide/Zinc carboxypeptidase